MPLFILITLFACAFFFFVAGQFENTCGLTWAGLSVALSLGIWLGLGGGLFAVKGGQIGLYAAITVYRSRKKG